MIPRRAILAGAAFVLGAGSSASAQVPLYAQSLPEGTVYIRLASALPAAATVQTDFAGQLSLGADQATRISPYYVAGKAGGKTAVLQVTVAGRTMTARFVPPTGKFVTVVLHQDGDGVTAAEITDRPEYNQLRARLSFYNATAGCTAGSLADASGKPVFSATPPNSAQSRSINPVAAKVVASCAAGSAPPLDLGTLAAGGLYSVWLIQPDGAPERGAPEQGALTAFVARDTIAPPQI